MLEHFRIVITLDPTCQWTVFRPFYDIDNLYFKIPWAQVISLSVLSSPITHQTLPPHCNVIVTSL